MMVWLHTASPPQHIGHVTEHNVGNVEKVDDYLDRVNATRGLRLEVAGVFEDERGVTSLHIFDTFKRRNEYVDRDNGMDWLI